MYNWIVTIGHIYSSQHSQYIVDCPGVPPTQKDLEVLLGNNRTLKSVKYCTPLKVRKRTIEDKKREIHLLKDQIEILEKELGVKEE